MAPRPIMHSMMMMRSLTWFLKVLAPLPLAGSSHSRTAMDGFRSENATSAQAATVGTQAKLPASDDDSATGMESTSARSNTLGSKEGR